MVLKILGWVLTLLGVALFIGAPGDRGQSETFGLLGRKIGFIMLIIGVILLKLF